MKLNIVAILMLGVTILSCTKKDKQTPRVESVEIRYALFNTRVQAGTTELVTIKFKDDKALKQYVVEIVPQGGLTAKNGFELLTLSNAQSISGKSTTETFSLNIPANVTAGLYNFVVYALDAAGNESPIYTFELIVESKNHAPKILGIGLNEGGTFKEGVFHTSRGRVLKLKGRAEDIKGLVDFRIKVLNKFDKVEFDQTKTFNPAVTAFYLDSATMDVNIPNEAITGGHRIQLTARDTDGHNTFSQYGLEVEY